MAEQTQRSLPSPFLIPTLFWVLGIGLATLYHFSIIWIAIIGVITVISTIIFKFKLPFLAIIFLIAGFFRLTLAVDRPQSHLQQILSQRESITQACSGEIIKVLNLAHDTYLIKLTSVRNVSVADKAVMHTNKRLLPGDRFNAVAMISLRKPDSVLDETSFYMANSNRQVLLDLKQVYKLTTLPSNRSFNFERWRYNLLQSLDNKLGNTAPFAKALLLNDRTEDKDWIQQLIQGGLLHLIAISGLHVLLFYFIFVTLLNVFLPRRVAELVFLMLMLVYAGLCQWSAPVMRAIVMILIYVISRIMQRKVSPLQIICLSLFVITLVDPVQLFSIGLQLSYLCVLILAYAIPKWNKDNVYLPMWRRKLNKTLNYFTNTILITVIITLVLLPLTMFYFQRGSFNGIIGNIIGVPFMEVLLPLTFVLMFIPSNWLIFQLLKATFDLLYLLFQKWVAWTASLPLYVDSVNLSLPWLIATYLIIAVIIIRWKSGVTYRKLTYGMLILALCTAGYSQLPRHKLFTLTVFNAGLGDCSLIEYPQGQTVMIDTGPESFSAGKHNSPDWFGYKPRNWFKHNNITTIDILVLSHLDADHRGGLEEVFQNLDVRRLIISKHDAESQLWQQLKQATNMMEAKVTVISDTLSFSFAKSNIAFLYPDKDFHADSENDNSLVVRIDYKDFSALFPGDISSAVEEHLVDEYPTKLDCDFLKVPHHGSRYSSSPEFIKAVSPKQACITASLHNRFHFPDKETLAHYRSYGIEPQITGNGSVVVSIK